MAGIDYLLPEGLNPEDIVLNYTSPYGLTQVTFGDLDYVLHDQISQGAIFGARVSVSIVVIIVSYFVSRNRRAPIFIVNQLALLCIAVHSGLYLRYLNGVYDTMAFQFSYYNYIDRDAAATSVATNVFQILIIAFIEASLVLQTYTIFKSPKRIMRFVGIISTALALLLGLASTGLYFASSVYLIINLTSSELRLPPWWVASVPLAVFTASFVVVCFLLVVKLLIAIRTRRFLGLKQFDIFHILFIVSSQTMIIPTAIIVASFGYSGHTSYNYLSGIGIPLVAISLPLTTMWANSSVNDLLPSSSADTYLQKTPTSPSTKSLYRGASGTLVDHSPTETTTSEDDDFKNSSWWIEANLEAAENGYEDDDYVRKTTTKI